MKLNIHHYRSSVMTVAPSGSEWLTHLSAPLVRLGLVSKRSSLTSFPEQRIRGEVMPDHALTNPENVDLVMMRTRP